MKNFCQAFTLIELMVVIVIIGILAAIAAPAYRGYTVRARVAEAYYFIDSLKKNAIKQYNENQTGQRIFSGYPRNDAGAAVNVIANGGKFIASQHEWQYSNGALPDFNDTPLNFFPAVTAGGGGNSLSIPPVFNNAEDKFMTRDGGDGTACIANEDYVASNPTDYGIIVTEDPGYNWFGIMMLGNFAYPFRTSCVTLVMTGSTTGGEFSMTPVIELK